MKFFVYDPNWDPATAALLSPEVEAAMGKLEAAGIQAGWLVSTGYGPLAAEAQKAGGLATTDGHPPQGTRLQLAEGKFTVTDGPFIELKELTAGFALLQTDSLEAVVEWCKRFRQIIGDGESEIVRIMGPGDMGMH